MTILMPALKKAKSNAYSVISSTRQRKTAFAVAIYATDSDGWYPTSIASPEPGSSTPWREPTLIVAPGTWPYCSVSSYLRNYIKDAKTIICPSAPNKYKYLQEIWDAGDDWYSPDGDQFFGTYCFYWNYVGYLEDDDYPFRGPRRSSDGRKYSKLLTSDYLGFGHWRNVLTYGRHDAYGCCDKFNGAGVTQGTPVSADFWSRLQNDGEFTLETMNVKLQAAYTDGHVETYSPIDTMTMRIALTPDGTVPCPTIGSAGEFFIPAK